MADEIFHDVATKAVSSEAAYITLLREQITPHLSELLNLSSEDIQSIRSYVDRSEDINALKSIITGFRVFRIPDESKAMLNLVRRIKSAETGPAVSLTKVHTPLDSLLEKDGDRMVIYLPDHLESVSDRDIIPDLFRLSTHIPIRFERVAKTDSIPLIKSADCDRFFMGFIQELVSNQSIASISYEKSNPSLIGRNCARVKLLGMVLDQAKIPMKFLHVPQRYIGGTKEFTKSELYRQIVSYVEGVHVETVYTLLENLCRVVVRTNRQQVIDKLSKKLFLSSSELISTLHRSKPILQTGRGKRKLAASVTIKPTKPSQIVTVAPWERDAITEYYEYPWERFNKLIDTMDKIDHPIKIDYLEIEREFSQTLDLMWREKQKVLRRTQKRLDLIAPNKAEPLWQRLNTVRVEYTDCLMSMERIFENKLDRSFNPIDLFDSKYTTKDGYVHSISEFGNPSSDLSVLFPKVHKLFMDYRVLYIASKPAPAGSE